MNDIEFSIESTHGTVIIDVGDTGVFIGQPCDENDPDREPGDSDVIHLTLAEARVFHEKLGDALAKLGRE